MEATPARKEREVKVAAQQAEFLLYSKLPLEAHFFYAEMIRLARAYTSLDDLEHYQTTRLNQPLRRGLRALGERLVARGILTEPMDIFYAHEAQIDDAVGQGSADAWETLGELIRIQKQACLADAARAPEWVLGESIHDAEVAVGDLSGLAGSPGIAEGAVFKVLSAADFAKFPKGAVLVAHTTSPTWTPLFYIASAVITASGGPLSHGAVTAREMGIPAVMAVRDCVTRLENSQRVRVDGSRGQVSILETDGQN
ncbi:MAG: PEP-utilizing enzyme, partial [Verrucomicrobium sp.]